MKDHSSRIVPAPMASDPRLRPTILDVVCGLNEEVEWHWTMTGRGPLVSGYSIVRRLPRLNEFADPTKTYGVGLHTESSSGKAAAK